jgi:multiple sugar transport system substrate-binding protein
MNLSKLFTFTLVSALQMVAASVAHAADLVVWWEEGYYEEEKAAVREVVAAFEAKSGKQVDLVVHTPAEQLAAVEAAIANGMPPDFLYGVWVGDRIEKWAYDGRLVDLAAIVEPLPNLFDADVLEWSTLLDGTTGQRGLHALPMARSTIHLHVWTSLLERVGFTLADIPKEWGAFWSFWCDTVQPALRRELASDDLWAVGLPMSPIVPNDTLFVFMEFVHALDSDYVTPDGRLVIDEPRVRDGLVEAVDGYTAVWRKGCTPPDALTWDGRGNNKAFLTRRVVMTANQTLSIPNTLRTSDPDAYLNEVATIEWPGALDGEPLSLEGDVVRSVVFEHGPNLVAAKEFVRFLVEDHWLAHWASAARDRFLPPMRSLIKQPFWLDTRDPHRLRSAIQTLAWPHAYSYAVVSGDWRHRKVNAEGIWPKAIHRVVADGFTPEEAVDQAIARIKEILEE